MLCGIIHSVRACVRAYVCVCVKVKNILARMHLQFNDFLNKICTNRFVGEEDVIKIIFNSALNTFAITYHVYDTAVRFESLASHTCDIVDYPYVYKLIINYQLLLPILSIVIIDCCWLPIYVFYMYTSEYVRHCCNYCKKGMGHSRGFTNLTVVTNVLSKSASLCVYASKNACPITFVFMSLIYDARF